MVTNERYTIEKIFPILDQKYLLVNLKENCWDLKGEKNASIIFKDEVSVLRYIGFSNVNGKIILKLISLNENKEEFDKIIIKLENQKEQLYLEI